MVALSAETQAISIYEAQISWRPEPIFIEILAEEKAHQKSLNLNLPKILRLYHRCSGYLLGLILCFLPRPLCYRVHVWAEKQAALVYQNCSKALKKLDLSASEQIYLEILAQAEQQEWGHAEQFALHYEKGKKPLS